MHGIIVPYSGIAKPLNYNEKKVRAHQAECLYAGNFLKNADELDIEEKRARFERQIALNHQASQTVLQFFLGFSPRDRLDREKMIEIANTAMQRTGFGEQPFLVYNHADAGRPHLHIVTTKIRPDGTRMPFYAVRDWVNVKMVHQLELELGLSTTRIPTSAIKPDPPGKAKYGTRPTLDILSDILRYVLDAYNYRSFDQFNAILRQYNVTAVRGLPGSRLHQYHGLLYIILDDNGKKISTPVKASTIRFKPTLSRLEKKFAENAQIQPTAFRRTNQILDAVLRQHPADPEQFSAALRTEQLAATPFFKDHQLMGLFFIDLKSKIVIAPNDLGSQYDPVALRQTLGFDPFPAPSKTKSKQQQAAETKRENTQTKHR